MANLEEVQKPEYNLGRTMQIDRSSDNIVYRVYKPDVAYTAPTSDSVPSNIVYSLRDLGEFFLLSDSYISVVGKFVKTNGVTALDENDRPALECASTSFFSQSRLRLNSQLIEDNSTLSHINAFVRGLTTMSPDYASTCCSNTGFTLDTGTGYAVDEDITVTAAPAINRNINFNAGYRERRRQAGGCETKTDGQLAGSIERSYVVRLSDLFSAANCRKVMKNVNLRIELTTRSQQEMLFQPDIAVGGGAGSNSCKFVITDMDLVIAVHNPSLDVLAELESELASGNDINYQYLKYQTYESDVSNGGDGGYRSFTFNTSSQKPIGGFLTTQRVKTDAGAERNYNSMIFDNCNLSNVRMKVNGKQFPYSEFECAFSNDRVSKNYARPYEELLRFMSKNYDISSGALITSDQWANLYPLYWVPFHNLSPSASYQLTAEVKRKTGNFATGDGSRSLTHYKIYMVLLTVGEFTISGDRSGVIVRSQ
jgi:hypothetical protein